jgi:hypothetical protein
MGSLCFISDCKRSDTIGVQLLTGYPGRSREKNF